MVLHGVDEAHLGIDAGAREHGGKRERQPLVVAVGHHDLESERAPAAALAQRRAFKLVAGRGEQSERRPQASCGRGPNRR